MTTATVASNVPFKSKLTAFNKYVNTGFACVERALDIPGYIPGVNVFSGAVRSGVALIQAVYGFALLIFAGIKHLYCLSRNIQDSGLHNIISDATYLLKNGAFNVVRASFEVGTFGGILCLIYDFFKSRYADERLGGIYGANISNVKLHSPLIAKLWK